MVYMTAAECEAQGGACPRVCLDMTPAEVQCATTCYNGCYCAPGFYLLNGSCVPLAQCPCYHKGELHQAGATLPVDGCNNWYSQPASRFICVVNNARPQSANINSLCLPVCVCETAPALMEKWSVGQLPALVSCSISSSLPAVFRCSVFLCLDFSPPSSCSLSGLWLEQLDPVERVQPDVRCWREEALPLGNQSPSGLWGSSVRGRQGRDRYLQHRTLLW